MDTQTLTLLTPTGLATVRTAQARAVAVLDALRRELLAADLPLSAAAAAEPEASLRAFAVQAHASLDAAAEIARRSMKDLRDIGLALDNLQDAGAGLHMAAAALQLPDADPALAARGRDLFAPRVTAVPIDGPVPGSITTPDPAQP